jgi:hypothetical protein
VNFVALNRDSENTPLQLKLNDLAGAIAEFGSIAGGLLFVALLNWFFVELGTNNPEVPPTILPDAEPGLAFAVDHLRDRMRGSSFVRKSRSAGPVREGPRLV